MRNKQIIILLSLCLCFACAKAQFISIDNDSNLIYNPSFEEHLSRPQRIDLMAIWTSQQLGGNLPTALQTITTTVEESNVRFLKTNLEYNIQEVEEAWWESIVP